MCSYQITIGVQYVVLSEIDLLRQLTQLLYYNTTYDGRSWPIATYTLFYATVHQFSLPLESEASISLRSKNTPSIAYPCEEDNCELNLIHHLYLYNLLFAVAVVTV